MYTKPLIIKDSSLENQIFSNRLIIGWLCMMVALTIIITRLFILQVTHHDRYTTLSETNRLKVLPIGAPRGLIYDRNGVLLAGNHVTYNLEMSAEQANSETADNILQGLIKIGIISEVDVASFKKILRQTPRFKTVTLRSNLNEEEIARFSVQRYSFPGVDIVSNFARYYPLDSVAAHIIGYVGQIDEREVEKMDKSEYSGNSYIGKMGIEKYYEKELHGQAGFQQVETNVQGRIVRTLQRKPPSAGRNLYLNIDIELQKYVEGLFNREKGSLVAIEPSTGAVLALVSMPSFNPNLFVNGVDAKTYKTLRDSPERPLFNRALRGQYPPGSTIKPFVGLAGLEYGIRNEGSRTGCRGWYSVKGQSHRYRCWKKSGHGAVNLLHAIEQSCDVYFYSLANDLGIDRLYGFMHQFGFGEKTGIDVYGELGGLMPSREWKERTRRRSWYAGETVIVGIGQGYMLSTPLQLAVATAGLSMRGKIKHPRVVFATDEGLTNEQKVIRSPLITPIVLKQQNYWDTSINGMQAVVRSGTAYKVSRGAAYSFAGKTGTSQVVGIKQGQSYNAKRLAKRFHDHALFISFAPLDKPRIAIAVIVENGNGGSKTAAPLARKAMDFYLLPRENALQLAEKAASGKPRNR